ncbi:prepilin peptidase [Leucobacter chironomi]|uniref:prepilin peptidase n=1 Tax=Leucobacter chironomi TaxID=491918 RepID=UPI000409D847|nr:A24 family peptidase [Leucobacter chironomi]
MQTPDPMPATASAATAIAATTIALAAAALATTVVWWWPRAGADVEGPAFWLLLAAYLLLAVVSAVLAVIDLVSRTLPNAILLPSGAALLALVIATSAAAGDPGLLIRSVVCGLALATGYGLLWRCSPRSLGGGDVKLAALLGVALGPLGWGSALLGAVAPFLLGGVFAAGLLIVQGLQHRAGSGADPRSLAAFPFGPWMLAGAWTGVFAGADIAAGILTPP